MNKHHRNDVLLGALPDPRSCEERLADLNFSDIAMASPVNWTAKPQSAWRKYAVRNQATASDCVGNGTAKALETRDRIVYSAHPVYARRSNLPGPGMFLADAGNILRDKGTATEMADPSNNTTEAQMNLPVSVPTPKTIKGYGFVNVTDLDAIANAIDAYGGCPITVIVCWDEWNTEGGVPKYIPGAVPAGGHCMCAVDYTLWNGEKAIVCENSWGNDNDSLNSSSQVVLTQSFLSARGQQCMFMIPVPEQPVVNTLTLTRNSDDGYQTLGTLTGLPFAVRTLERPWLGNAHNVSCIPKGTYHCSVSHLGTMNIQAYLLESVIGRSGIFIHPGNYLKDTEGCILVGSAYADINGDGYTDIINSRATFKLIMDVMAGKAFTLVIK